MKKLENLCSVTHILHKTYNGVGLILYEDEKIPEMNGDSMWFGDFAVK